LDIQGIVVYLWSYWTPVT